MEYREVESYLPDALRELLATHDWHLDVGN
jgi:hypothetical protein